MKSSNTNTKANNTEQASAKPFFDKGGEGSFFSSGIQSEQPFFTKSGIQASMTVGQPNDPFEQEAEKVSRQVMGSFDSVTGIQRKLSSLGVQTAIIQPMPVGAHISRRVQRHSTVQTKCDQCEQEEKMAQPKALGIQFAGDGAMVPAGIEAGIQSRRGGGSGLDAQTRSAMEGSFGADFSGVKVHTDSHAVQMSQQLNAHAFTVGNDIFFNQGRYRPQTKEGAGLLAHELTHTVQQGASVQTKRINRQPLLNMLSKHAAAHGSADNSDVPALSRKEIAQLEQMPEEEKTKLQQVQMLQMKGADEIQKKDSSLKLRRCPTSTPARRAVLKSGPTYTPNGTIRPVVSGSMKEFPRFSRTAEFENDPSKGIYASCGIVMQSMKWSVGEAPPNHLGWQPASSYSADTWYEDRNASGLRASPRSGSNSMCASGASNGVYYDASGNRDCANGVKFEGHDQPKGFATRTGFWYFKLEAIDVCNGNKVLGTDYVTAAF